MPHNLITLPRSELYERVWSKPVRDVAQEFGISGVALAKRCRALKIPVPHGGERGVSTTRPARSSRTRVKKCRKRPRTDRPLGAG
jgi:hypothetical protein